MRIDPPISKPVARVVMPAAIAALILPKSPPARQIPWVACHAMQIAPGEGTKIELRDRRLNVQQGPSCEQLINGRIVAIHDAALEKLTAGFRDPAGAVVFVLERHRDAVERQ